MNNYENEVFGFSSDANEELEQASNFNYILYILILEF